MGHQFCIRGTIPGIESSESDLTGMLEYYRGDKIQINDLKSSVKKAFDPVAQKYDLEQITSGILNDLQEKREKCEACLNKCHIQIEKVEALGTDEQKQAFVYERVFEYLQNQESSYQLASLTKKDFTHVMENLYMIYNTDDEEIRHVVQLIHLVSQNVIGRYIQIDGLERLFNEQYIDFEWEMHLGMDHKQQTMKFYRDHFIHQVRDAYMMDQLLRNGGFYQRTLQILSQPSASKISQYFCKMVKRQKRVPLANAELLEHDPDFVPRNIIYMSAYMAGLFHDIGYPDTYLQSLRRRISAFAPGMNPGNPMRDTLPGDIFSLLQNSLLFRVVPFEEIQTRVYQDNIDHGTLSAIAFLLHFYENGVIFMLPPYQAAAVELAGLAIYNHTYVYGISGAGKKPVNDYRPRFLTNPISYLLRLCDDLQEWDRVYFEISSNSNLITCNCCYTPIVGRESEGKGAEKRRLYVCNCYDEEHIKTHGGAFSRTFDGNLSFPYRRLYNIQICDYVQAETMDGKGFDDTRDICFKLHYDPYKLLHIVYISPSYARYRIRELNHLKSLLPNQTGLPNIWLSYFVTANPILLKTNLLEEFFEGHSEAADIQELILKLREEEKGSAAYLKTVTDRLMELLDPCLTLWDTDPSDESDAAQRKSIIQQKIKRALRLYCMLYIYGKIVRSGERCPAESLQWVVDRICEEYCNLDEKKEEEFQCLLGDCLLQLSRLYTNDQLRRMKYVPNEYMCQFSPGNWKRMLTGQKEERCSKEFYDRALEWYVNQRKYRPVCWKTESVEERKSVDAFTDLGFFQMLYEKNRPKASGT